MLNCIGSELVKKVLWDPDEKNLEAMIRDHEFDIALEWQYGHQDHMVLDLVEKYNNKAREKVIGHMRFARHQSFGVKFG